MWNTSRGYEEILGEMSHALDYKAYLKRLQKGRQWEIRI